MSLNSPAFGFQFRSLRSGLENEALGVDFISLLFLLVIAGYVSYVMLSYSRIEDDQTLEITGTARSDTLKTDREYTAVTYNIGFGAYTPDYTFFMDGGTQSWADSEESVINCINGDIALLKRHQSDFALIQEVDTDATRSYHVDQSKLFYEGFTDSSASLAVNYHSAFLFYPILQPHGASNSGLLTLSNTKISSAMRRSLPIAESMSKFLDLDRCYSLNYINTENGKQLVPFSREVFPRAVTLPFLLTDNRPCKILINIL